MEPPDHDRTAEGPLDDIGDAEERLRRTQAIAHLGSWELDLAANRLTWSDEVYRIFGLEPQQFGASYEAFLEAVHPEDRAAVDAAYAGSLREGRDSYEIEHRIVRRTTEEIRHVHEKCEHVRDSSGRIVRSLGMVHDITERKQAEERVRQLNESLERRNAELDAERMRWRGVVEGIAEEVWICDAEGRISLINLPDTTTMGLEEFDGRTVHEVVEELEIRYVDGRVRPPEEAPLLRSLRTGEVVRGDEIMRHRGTGKERYRQYSCAPTRDATGAITGAVAIVRDITENKRTEQALREADRLKDEFIAMLSHELRNPLAPIQSSLYVLDRVPPGTDPARRARAVLERQVGHMTRLVNDLLDASRITRGKILIQRVRLDLREVVSHTIEDHRSLISAAGLELQVEQPNAAIWAEVDPTRLAQALGNLLQNAVKFTPPGGRVSVRLERKEGAALLTVRDSGVGIAPDLMPRLFEPFTQADRSLDRTAGGLGLGLSLAKGLIELHGGELHASSDGPGRGASFVIRLPAEVVRPPGVQEKSQEGPPRGRRVLVIEDNLDSAQSLKEVLELCGHEVVLAYTGAEGLARVRAIKPDVVLCDIGLPGMDGYAVARALRAEPTLRRTYLVALTGYVKAEDVQESRAAGFDRHMAKPPDIDTLARVLAELPLDPSRVPEPGPRAAD